MRAVRRKRSKPPAKTAPEPRSAFAWPSRADAARRASAASEIADAALTRLRATHAPSAAPEDSLPTATSEAPRKPDPWSREFDELAERLIDDLRRDLGPGRPSHDAA